MTALKVIRQDKGMTQAELAKATNLSQPYIHDLERGNRGAKRETWRKIASALGCKVEELTEGNVPNS